MKIGIFGGTFDPYTKAHAAIVDGVLGNGLVDEMIVMPTVVDWYRPGKAKWLLPEQKAECIRTFCEKSPYADRIIVDTAEFGLSDVEKANRRYVHMLSRITCEHGIGNSYITVIGADSYRDLKTWWNYRAVLEMSDIICINGREGFDAEANVPKWKPTDTFLTIDDSLSDVSASKIREKYAEAGFKAYVRDIMKGIA